MQDKIVYIVAGPNGSGKTTFAKEFIKEVKLPFVNADEIASKLCPNKLEKVRVQAGKIFFKRIENFIEQGESFIIETTLAGRYLLRFISKFKQNKYKTILMYIFVENEKEAIRRIDIRVKKGGHLVLREDIIRRFKRSKTNFWNTYRHLVNNWEMFLNSKDEFLQIAAGHNCEIRIINEVGFSIFKEGINDDEKGL